MKPGGTAALRAVRCDAAPPRRAAQVTVHRVSFGVIALFHSRRAAAAGTLAASAFLLAACGSGNGEDGKQAQQIVNDAKAAVRAATSFHVAGSVKTDSSTTSVDVKVDGSKSAGHVSQDGTAFDFVEIGSTLYLRGKDFLASAKSQDVADTVGDKWLKTSTDDSDFSNATSGIDSLTKPSAIADSLGSKGGPYSKTGTGSVDGQSVVFVKGPDGTMAVATSGKPYPVRLDGGSHGSIDMTQYGASFGISAPGGAVDVSSVASSSDTSTSTDSSSTDSSSDKVIGDATKERDGILEVAQGTITDSSGSGSDAWGVAGALTKLLPSSIDVSVQQGDASAIPGASPTRVVLYVQEGGSGDLFLVVVNDDSGNCEAGALTGTPPNQNPQKTSVPSGQDCTVQNALAALGG